MFKKNDRNYKFKDAEIAKIYFCDMYSREQGQVHIYLFELKQIINNNENVRLYNENSEKKIY